MIDEPNQPVITTTIVDGEPVTVLFDPGKTVAGCSGSGRMFSACVRWALCFECVIHSRCEIRLTFNPDTEALDYE